jgi:ABC-type polysaccharide/polyol phosphate export permease
LAIESPTAGKVTSFELHGEWTSPGTLLREMWQTRDLLRILARKEFFVRYRRAVFGLVWAVVLPLLQAVIVATLLRQFDLPFDVGTNYVVFVFSGMLVWTFFSSGAAAGATAIVDSTDLTTKIYFPRAILPLVRVLSNAYGLLLTIVIMLGMALVTGSGIGPEVLLLVPATLLLLAFTAGFTLTLSALHVYFRDTRYLVQAVMLGWFYATPVFYPVEAAKNFAAFVKVNPITGPVELTRAAIGADAVLAEPVLWSVGFTVVFLLVGLLLHCRYNRVFVDLL